jgi:hypothetical protein
MVYGFELGLGALILVADNEVKARSLAPISLISLRSRPRRFWMGERPVGYGVGGSPSG